MRRFLWITMIALAGLVTITSCDREKFDYGADSGTGEDGPKGVVSFVDFSLSIQIKNDIQAVSKVTGRALEANDFTVRIFRNGNQVEEFLYKDLPATLPLLVGSYTITASYGENPAAAFDAPYYYDEKDFTVVEDKTTTVEPLVAVLSNVQVNVNFDANMQELIGDNDYEVEVTMVDGGSLTFKKENEEQSGYFRAVNDVLNASFNCIIDGQPVSYGHQITEVEAGQLRNITYRFIKTGSGTGNLEVTLNGDVDDEEQTIVVTPGEGGGEEPGPGPEPGGAAPSISGDNFNIKEPVVIKFSDLIDLGNFQYACSIPVKVDIECVNGIKDFWVEIKIPDLDNEDLIETVGITSKFNLADPGEIRSTLESAPFNFPVAEHVVGKTSLTFDVTDFMPLLFNFGEITSEFVLTVTDPQDQTTTETLTITTEM